MKYNKSEIMKAAWNLFNMSKKWIDKLSFSECLRRAWKKAKEAIAAAKKLDSGDCRKLVNGEILEIKHGVVADFTMGWYIVGKTYAARKELKAAGFKWAADCGHWYTTDRKVAEYFC